MNLKKKFIDLEKVVQFTFPVKKKYSNNQNYSLRQNSFYSNQMSPII